MAGQDCACNFKFMLSKTRANLALIIIISTVFEIFG